MAQSRIRHFAIPEPVTKIPLFITKGSRRWEFEPPARGDYLLMVRKARRIQDEGIFQAIVVQFSYKKRPRVSFWAVYFRRKSKPRGGKC